MGAEAHAFGPSSDASQGALEGARLKIEQLGLELAPTQDANGESCSFTQYGMVPASKNFFLQFS